MLRVAVVLVLVIVAAVGGEEADKVREKRSAQHGGYHRQEHQSYQKKTYYKTKQCYQCAYSPPKTYYDKKVYVEHGQYGKHYEQKHYNQQQHGGGYGGRQQQGGYGQSSHGGGYHGGYIKKNVVPVPYTVYGGWDKCIGPFTHYEAKHFGIDEWDCHSNCYTRRDPNGDVFRGCYKGEYAVNPYKLGCHKQAGSVYCFCEGDKCNNGPSPPQH